MGIVQGVARGFLNHLKITEFNETEKIDYDAGRTGGSGCGNAAHGAELAAHGAGVAVVVFGQAGITEATQLVTGYFDPGTKLVYAVGAIIGLIGGVKVYQKFSSGDPDTSKTASSWFGACIFLIVAATILRSFFL